MDQVPRISKHQPGAVLSFRLGNNLSSTGVSIWDGETEAYSRHFVTVDIAKKWCRCARLRLV